MNRKHITASLPTLATVAVSPVAASAQFRDQRNKAILTKTDYSRVAADFSWV